MYYRVYIISGQFGLYLQQVLVLLCRILQLQMKQTFPNKTVLYFQMICYTMYMWMFIHSFIPFIHVAIEKVSKHKGKKVIITFHADWADKKLIELNQMVSSGLMLVVSLANKPSQECKKHYAM